MTTAPLDLEHDLALSIAAHRALNDKSVQEALNARGGMVEAGLAASIKPRHELRLLATIIAAARVDDLGALVIARDLLRDGHPALAESQLTTYLQRFGR